MPRVFTQKVTHSSTKRVKRVRKEQGWENQPPICLNCTEYRPTFCRIVNGEKVFYKGHCNLGKFRTFPHSVCDKWVGKDGTKLEGEDGE